MNADYRYNDTFCWAATSSGHFDYYGSTEGSQGKCYKEPESQHWLEVADGWLAKISTGVLPQEIGVCVRCKIKSQSKVTSPTNRRCTCIRDMGMFVTEVTQETDPNHNVFIHLTK